MKKQVRSILRRGQRGFTLIELLAVMAILAILVAVVAPSVTGTRDASIMARAQADAKQVTTAAADFYGDQNEAETRTPHSTAVGAISMTAANIAANLVASSVPTYTGQQFVSNRWPEKFITESGAANSAVAVIGDIYATEFESVEAPMDVRLVTLLKEDNKASVDKAEFLSYTAIDLVGLVTSGKLAKLPAGANETTDFINTAAAKDAASVKVHNFLWLFVKGSSGAGEPNDIRTVAVFQLTATEIIETPVTATQGAFVLELTYKRIL